MEALLSLLLLLLLQTLCNREAEMWDDDAAMRRHLEMDDGEESERAPQQTASQHEGLGFRV